MNYSPQALSGPQADFTWPAAFIFKNLSQMGDFPFNLDSLLFLKTLKHPVTLALSPFMEEMTERWLHLSSGAHPSMAPLPPAL